MDTTNHGSNLASSANNIENEWQLLEALEAQSETSQADLAARAGVAVGTVNWYLKKWAAKGYVKIKRIDRWRWSYLLTPQGMTRKATLAREYVEASMSLYRRTREKARVLLGQLADAGYDAVYIDGQGEIAEICHLTCLEMGIQAQLPSSVTAQNAPSLAVDGITITLKLPESHSS